MSGTIDPGELRKRQATGIRSALLCLAFVGWVVPFHPLAASAPRARVPALAPDVLLDLERWCERLMRSIGTEELPEAKEAEELVEKVSAALASGAVEPWRALEALLALHAAGDELWLPGRPDEAKLGARLRALASGRARSLVRDDAIARRLASEILLRREGPTSGERAAAAALLELSENPESRTWLALAARAGEPRVRSAALAALVLEPSNGVQAAFVEALRDADRVSEARSLHAVEKHFRAIRLKDDSRSVRTLAAVTGGLFADPDWREISRATSVSRALPDAEAVPLLIDALEAWQARVEREPRPLPRRVEGDMLVELEARAGESLGSNPARWRAWWKDVTAGEIAAGTPHVALGTEASFFGVRPDSDRVTFVVDASGSMQSFFRAKRDGAGSQGLSRYQAAVEELVLYVESMGEGATFNVVLFHERAERWRRQAGSATSVNVKAVRAWLLAHAPDGDTHLRRGIHAALGTDEAGGLRPERLDFDTIVVLCDGATAEGAAWVEPALGPLVARARVRFHCVQIGSGGDGTLEALASESGGNFVRVDP